VYILDLPMKNFIIVFLVFFISCKGSDKNTVKDNSQETSLQNNALSKVFEFSDLADTIVIKTLFDAKKVIKGTAYWLPDFEEKLNFLVSEDGYCNTSIDTIFYYGNEKYKNAIVLYSTIDTTITCHACAPTLSIATFYKINNDKKWKLDRFKKNWILSGSWGKSCSAELVEIGSGEYAIRKDEGYFGQGVEESSCTFYELYSFEKIFTLSTSGSNTGNFEEESPLAYDWVADLKVVKPSSQEVPSKFDISVHITGKKPVSDGGPIKKINKKVIYRFIDGIYQPI